MKRSLLLFAASLVVALTVACGSINPPDATPTQKAVNVTAVSCQNIDAAIVAADQAVKAGVLKGDNARSALKGLTAAQTGCVTALASIQAAAAVTAASAPK